MRVVFEPQVQVGPISLRWEAVGLALSIALALGLWARLLAGQRAVPISDLGYVVLGVVPGAVVGGRIFHGIAYADAYLLDPGALFDLSRGSISLVGAVLGGAFFGAYVCLLLGHSPRRWAAAGALPLLLLIGLGKLSLALAGGGQGGPSEAAWAVSFGGAGPWLSSDPAVPAHPAQIYEGVWVLMGFLCGSWLVRRGSVGMGARLLAYAVCWWLAGRTLVSLSWRDEPVIGPLGGEGVS
ncbi:MAG: prolipoprotein diacylglyceryl transferase family protein, partial [Candidatus Limnocylindrales bacterium]